MCFFLYIFIFLIQQINQTLLSNGKHSLNHNSVPFVKKGLVLFNHLQFNCIAWDSIRNVSMNLAFNYYTGPTEIGTLTKFLAANITLARCYNPQDQDNLYQANKHHYWVHSNLLGSKITWFLNNYFNDSNTVSDLKKVTKLTRKIT